MVDAPTLGDHPGAGEQRVHPADVGLGTSTVTALAGGTAAENAAAIESVLDGETGPRRDVVLLNAGAALLVAGHAESLSDGIAAARESLSSGRARGALARLRSLCGR